MHNGFLQVEGEKMSKSLGNFVTIRELLETETFGGKRWDGATLRLAMLRTHYRQPIDWTGRRAGGERQAMLARWRNTIRRNGAGPARARARVHRRAGGRPEHAQGADPAARARRTRQPVLPRRRWATTFPPTRRRRWRSPAICCGGAALLGIDLDIEEEAVAPELKDKSSG